jgi:hypothetical protein
MYASAARATVTRIAFGIACLSLSCCVDLAEERQVASSNLQTFVGQPIQA